MILFDLKCATGHVFEAWFRDGATYEAQRDSFEILCPFCGSSDISKAPMAPRLAGTGSGERNPVAGEETGVDDAGEGQASAAPLKAPSGELGKRITRLSEKVASKLAELRTHIEENFDYVGDRFPEEARKIHYGETEKKAIYGEATEEEVEDLAEEGVEISRVPFLRRH